MSKTERQLTIGFLINKFRGDPRLFETGIAYIENKTGKPVLGLVPYFEDIHIDAEDSVSVQTDKRPLKKISAQSPCRGFLPYPILQILRSWTKNPAWW